MLRFVLIFPAVFLFLMVNAQVDPEPQPGAVSNLQIKTSRLYGKLVDPRTGKGMEAISVQLLLAATDSALYGQLTRPNGDFSFSDLPAADSFHLVISATGFEKTGAVDRT